MHLGAFGCMRVLKIGFLKEWGNDLKQEGNVLQEPAAAMNLMFPLKI